MTRANAIQITRFADIFRDRDLHPTHAIAADMRAARICSKMRRDQRQNCRPSISIGMSGAADINPAPPRMCRRS